MKVFYSELNKEVNGQEPILTLVRNNHWFLWGLERKSRYFGYWFKSQDRIFKLIDSFEIPGLSVFDELKKIEIISPAFAKIYFGSNVLNVFLDSQGLILKTNKPLKIKINLNFGKLYSGEKFGNNYNVLPLTNGYLVSFIQEREKYNLEALLFYEGDLKLKNFWKETYNGFDERRKSLPYKNWVLEAFEGYFTEIKFFCPEKPAHLTVTDNNISDSSKGMTGFLLKRILSLYDDYFLAGLPWFCQYWFRDELISFWLLESFYKTNPLLAAIKNKITENYLENLENFALSNKPCGDNSADVLLWILLLLSQTQIGKNRDKIKNVFGRWLSLYFPAGKSAIMLSEKASWMDTVIRPRALEIDFLFIRVLQRLSVIDKCYLKQFTLEEYERKLKTLLVAEFYPKNELESPNVFLAYLLKPQFLSLQKWEKIFRAVIAKNWLEWGGFSTLPKSAPNFKKVHTGENSESYHQGDSWFWLNNVAAIAIKYFQEQANPDKMSGRRSDTKRFACSSYIEKVKSASVKNLLELDALGWSSELSSACQLKSEGSPIQLWSIASLLKLFSRE